MARTSPAMTTPTHVTGATSGRVQVIPLRVHCMNESDLPSPWPMLNRLLTLDRQTNVIERFVIDQQLQSVSLGKSVDQSFTVLICAARQIAGHTDVKYAVA